MTEPIYIDATMLLRWQHLAPVGIVRLERVLCGAVRHSAALKPSSYIVWEHGYRYATTEETSSLDLLLDRPSSGDDSSRSEQGEEASASVAESLDQLARPAPQVRMKRAARRLARGAIERAPSAVRPLLSQAVIANATLAVETARLTKRTLARKRGVIHVRSSESTRGKPCHTVDFARGSDLICLGLGWEYLDHEAMFALSRHIGVRIHMPAFDLIGVDAPQFNVGQRDPVHRYYAEMAHYADTISCISASTKKALESFYRREELPIPEIVTNPLPGISSAPSTPATKPRAPFWEEDFVLSVSTVEIRKNHILLAKLWTELIREGRDVPHLVLIGRVGWDVSELIQWIRYAPELQGRFHLLTDVEDDELIAFYDASLFTLFPSRMEGWGLPISESLMRGKACVHSIDPAQSEASQGTMPALHPDDFMAWKQEVTRLLTDVAYRRSLEDRIDAHYTPRTPEEYGRSFEAHLIERRRVTQ